MSYSSGPVFVALAVISISSDEVSKETVETKSDWTTNTSSETIGWTDFTKAFWFVLIKPRIKSTASFCFGYIYQEQGTLINISIYASLLANELIFICSWWASYRLDLDLSKLKV